MQLLWMVGAPMPEPVDVDDVLEARVHTPDAGRADFSITVKPGAQVGGAPVREHPDLAVGARMTLGVLLGIAPHTLADGRIRSVTEGAAGLCLEATDLLADLDARHSDPQADTLEGQVRGILRAWGLTPLLEELVIPSGEPAVARLEGESDGRWLDRVAADHGLTVCRDAGPLPLSNRVRVAPLAMERTAMPPITPSDCLSERRFTPAPGVRVAELRLVASTALRGVLRGVHRLSGFGEDDGAWYAQDIVHHLWPTRYEQTVTLVRLSS